MELTGRQSIYLLLICSIATKVQTLPSMIASNLGRFGWLYYLFLALVDILFVAIALWINKLANGKTLYEMLCDTTGKTIAKIVSLLFGLYFLFSAILPYEALHNVFANILFEDLSWPMFSLLLVVAVFYLGGRGLKTIGRVGELYFRIIAVCLVSLLVISYSSTSLIRLLPLQEINISKVAQTSFNYSFWFGDFLLILMFMGKVKQEKWYTLKLILAYCIELLVIVCAYIIFYGIYGNLTLYQNNLVTDISEFSLLNLEIGRLDWFLMLGVQTSTIIACSVDIYLASYNFAKIIDLKKSYKASIFIVLIVYLLDIFVFKNITNSAVVVSLISRWFALVCQFCLPILILIIAIFYSKAKRGKYVEVS